MKPLIEHLDELRSRLIIIIIFFFVFFILGVLISPLIIKKIICDLSIKTITLVSLTPLEFIYTQLKVGFFFALFFASPIIIYHLFAFCKPGLKRNELSAIKYFLPAFLALFLAGIYFGYAVFLKVSIFFLANLSSLANIPNMWSIYRFISFILMICLSLGLIFQLPLFLLLLKALNLVSYKTLAKKRAYIYVSIFVIAAVLTPPDALTQILIALPLIILYELSLLVMRVV